MKLLGVERVSSKLFYIDNSFIEYVGGERPPKSQSGYGVARTGYKAGIRVRNKYGFEFDKLYVVYCMQYSNSGTLFIKSKGKMYILKNTFSS